MMKPTDADMIDCIDHLMKHASDFERVFGYEKDGRKLLKAIRDRLASLTPTNAPPLEWLECPPEKTGAYIVGSNVAGRSKEASLAYWDGTVWQHWSGLYDHAITHYMPTDLPEKKNG